MIDRFARVQDPSEIIEWVRSVKEKVPSLSTFMDFVAYTGIRFVEAVSSYNLITGLSRKQRLKDYYDRDRELLEHHKYKELFISRSKKLFISFAGDNLVRDVEKSKPLSKNAIKKRLGKAGLNFKFGDLREHWATTMTKRLRQPEIDFLQGRVSTTVFMRNDFNTAWVTDLKQRTLETSREILMQVSL